MCRHEVHCSAGVDPFARRVFVRQDVTQQRRNGFHAIAYRVGCGDRRAVPDRSANVSGRHDISTNGDVDDCCAIYRGIDAVDGWPTERMA